MSSKTTYIEIKTKCIQKVKYANDEAIFETMI